jgi:O-antigen/teichoic acid export membrane protein
LFYYSVVVNGANLAAIGLYSGDQAGLARLLILIWALGQLGAAIGLAGHIRRLPCRWVKMKAADYLNEAKRFLSYGMRAFVGNFASSLVNRADHLFVIAAAGPAGIGIYNLAAKWAELVFQPSAALESAAYARAASADRNQAAQLVLKLFRANVFLCALGVTVLIVLARPLVLCFYTEEYAEAVGPLRVLLPGALLLAGCRMLAIYFSAHLGKPQIPSAIAWMGALLNVALLSWIVMGRDGGLMGAAIATTSAYGLMFICYWVCFARATGRYGPAEYFLPRAEDWRRLSAAWEDFKRGSG